ncbi:GNAT family N-acetyltransferase [Calidifontibacter sp. DB0510]|uniref:GNAT family N-acetyltransferase n=1 Tax=Metallococcus carri TaxID=1656884 RepID=A0A967B420_9MICO|nr:GNAT family N-acetyltransferase [Metallococcus carri]NOP37720.1 GNAT family N-acetyltransferase [Calidifontibacter sp. DB2511S]
MPVLEALLAGQQPTSRYPFRWPLPFPAVEFLRRDTEERAWVAEVDGDVAGHVAVTTVVDDDFSRTWSSAVGRPVDELGCVSVLFAGIDYQGMGIGRALLDTAEDYLLAQGRTPVLDVVQSHSAAAAVYAHRGWRLVGTGRPDWLPDDEPDVHLMVLDR